MTHPLFDKHIDILRQAVAAAETRTPWSPYPDNPAGGYEVAIAAGREALDAYRDASFYLDQPGVIGRVGDERSPFGLPLNISYPQCAADALILAARNAMSGWVDAGPDVRTGVCLEILERLHSHGAEIAYAVMHTSGQAFAFAYQHSVASALDRGLESVASAYREMKQVPGRTEREKPQGKLAAIRMENTYKIAPRGVALAVSNPLDPTWPTWPGLFASLATANPVIVLAHPASVLPLAMTVAIARQVIKESGFDPNLVSLLVDDTGQSSATMVSLRPEIRILDYSGDSKTANWLEENAHQAAVFTFKTGANCVVVDSTDNYQGMLRNLTFSICLGAGQLAATPRLILVSREGVRTADGIVSAEQFGRDLVFAIGKLMESPAKAVEVLGAIHSPTMLDEIEALREQGDVMRDTSRVEHPHWPAALIASPLLLKLSIVEEEAKLFGIYGPIAFVADLATTTEALSVAERVMRQNGALNFSIYTTSAPIQSLAEDIASRVVVALNINLTGNLLISHTEAFADFYATGENAAASCCMVDVAYVARRFFVVQTRRQLG
jgi:hypothetical protein